jgi:hypothetical protein
MARFKAGSIPFALFLKLCEPTHDYAPTPERDTGASPRIDAGVSAADAGSGTDAAAARQDAGVGSSEGGAIASDASVAEILSGPPGLYADERCEQLAEGVRPYEPRYALWSDAAEKDRFVVLPEGAVIDGTDPDRWRYPTGIRFYKTFSRDGLKLETRIMEKTGSGYGPDAWSFRAYAWLPDQSGVQLVEATGRADVIGTSHDIPSVAQCRSCHGAAGQDAINGFSAIQLNHPRAGVTLAKLLDEGVLVSPLGSDLLDLALVPGDLRARASLGYLHSNCGNCHGGPTPRASMTLRLSVGQLEVEATSAYASAVGQPLQVWTGRSQANGFPIELRIAPSAAAASGVVARMSVRGSRDQMPPSGTELVDAEGVAAVSAWIGSL